MEYSEKVVDISDIEVPDVLYKYRSWSSDFHKNVIINQEVFFSPPSWFEDKKDCRIYRKLDYTDEQIFEIYFRRLMRENEAITFDQIREICFKAIALTQNAPLKNPDFLEAFKIHEFEQVDSMFGILSLTDTNVSIEMWEKYGDNGCGYCVELDGKKLVVLVRNYGLVNYTDELPEIILGEPLGIQVWKQMFNKERKWCFEQEHRFRIVNPNGLTEKNRIVKLSKDTLTSITFGWNMPDNDREEIRDSCVKNGLNVRFFESMLTIGVITLKEINN